MGPDVRDSNLRIGLLAQELRRRGLDLVPDHTVWAQKDALPAMRKLMQLAVPPTVVFCWHDWMAYRALEACDELGIQVPTQLSVVGYDGIHWPSTSKHIASSVEVDLKGIATEAVRLLDRAITEPVPGYVDVAVPVDFSLGTTLGPATSLQRSTT
jgi:LacI family transcriptional regulator